MKKLKGINFWHLLWLLGVYAILIVILIMIIEYKVKWESKDFSTYLYFYNCSNNLCTTSNPVANYYSSVKCNDNDCPYIKERENNLVILSLNEKDYVYDYYHDNIINNDYISYKFVSGGYIVKNDQDKYGIIDREGKPLTEIKYNKIISYRDKIFAYLENSKAGISKIDNGINIKPTYEDAIIISDKYYAYLEEGYYYIAAFDTELPVLDERFDYIYVTDNAILTVRDKKINILDSSLSSKLLLKIDSYYSYKTERERNSLNAYRVNDLLYFSVATAENQIVNYTYDIKNGKLL